MQGALANKLSKTMLFHGPPALSLQDQKENKPLPEIPVQIKDFPDKNKDGTRKKISEIGQDPKPKDDVKIRSDAASGVMNPVNGAKQSTVRGTARPFRPRKNVSLAGVLDLGEELAVHASPAA